MNNAEHSMLAGTRRIYSPTHTYTDTLTQLGHVHTGVGVLTENVMTTELVLANERTSMSNRSTAAGTTGVGEIRYN